MSEYKSGNNFFAYIQRGFFTGDFFYIDKDDDADSSDELDNSVITVGMDSDILKSVKKTYSAAQKIFSDYEVNNLKTDCEKLRAIKMWFYDNTTYGEVESDISEYSILVNHVGICTTYSFGTLYLCTLLNIPCDMVLSDDHMWNVVCVQEKWYYLDELHNVLLLGDKGMPNDSMYRPREIMNLDGKIKAESNDFLFPEATEPTEPVTEPETEPITEPLTGPIEN